MLGKLINLHKLDQMRKEVLFFKISTFIILIFIIYKFYSEIYNFIQRSEGNLRSGGDFP